MATASLCECSKTRRDLHLVEEEIASLQIAVREGDVAVLVELDRLLALQAAIEARLAVLVAA